MPASLNPIDLILHASLVVKLVMLLLLAASVWGWALIGQLEMAQRRAVADDRRFEKLFWSGADLKNLYQAAQVNAHRQGSEAVFYEGFAEFLKLKRKQAARPELVQGTERMLRVGLQRQQVPLERGLGTLSSIGSVSPSVGLFGTGWGIMNSFLGLSQAQQATLATVAPGIAEALIATAIGLFAAIPAVLAYNRHTARSEAIYQQRALFAEEFSALLQREAIEPSERGGAAA